MSKDLERRRAVVGVPFLTRPRCSHESQSLSRSVAVPWITVSSAVIFTRGKQKSTEIASNCLGSSPRGIPWYILASNSENKQYRMCIHKQNKGKGRHCDHNDAEFSPDQNIPHSSKFTVRIKTIGASPIFSPNRQIVPCPSQIWRFVDSCLKTCPIWLSKSRDAK